MNINFTKENIKNITYYGSTITINLKSPNPIKQITIVFTSQKKLLLELSNLISQYDLRICDEHIFKKFTIKS